MQFCCVKYFVIAVFICAVQCANAQEIRVFDALTSSEGLSENVVTSIYQDRKGLMWFGTYDGLNCYDGYHVRIYRHHSLDPFSLPDNHIGMIIQDGDGDLWIATGKGTGILDAATGRFETVFYQKTSDPAYTIQLIDATHQKILFICSGKTWLYNKKTKQLTYLQLKRGDDPVTIAAAFSYEHHIYAAISDRESPNASLYKFDNQSNSFSISRDFLLNKSRHTSDYYIYGLFADAKGRLWVRKREVSTGRECTQIINRDGSENNITGKFEHFNRQLMQVVSVGDQTIYLVYNDGSLYEWDDKYYRLDTLTNIENYGVTSLATDNKNLLWIGTKGKGVLKYNPQMNWFKNYTVRTPQHALHRNVVLGLFPFGNNRLCVIHDDHFLSMIHLSDGSVRIIDRGNMSIGNYEKQWIHLQRSNDTAGMIHLLHNLKNLPPVFPFSSFIVPPSSRQILFCDFGGGALRRYDKDRTLILNDISEIYHTWQGDTLWICNEASGLVAVHFPDQRYYRYMANATDSFSISSDKTKYLLFSAGGNLWIATDNGLNYFDKVRQQFYHYTEKDGLCNNHIYCMAYDQKGRIWLGTGNGLSCFDTATKKFINFHQADGLANSEYNRYAAWCAPDGRMYMGGTEGVDYFYPDELSYNTEVPKIIFSEFSLYGVHFAPEHLPKLQYHDNDITIAFTIVDYTHPAGNKFLYRLDGIRNEWKLLKGDNKVHYSLLPPGNYTFQVKAANSRGIWNQTPARLSFTILPPWYNTWIFYLVCTLMAATLIYFIIKPYINRKLEKQKAVFEKKLAIDNERLRISSELHDDLGGGLSTIRLISEIVKNKTLDEHASKQLNTISDSSRELVQRMNEIVWALNVNNDNLQSLFAYMRQYIAKTLDDAGIHCSFKMPAEVAEISISGNDRRNIFLMVKECIHNIMKHSKASEVEIEISLSDKISIHIHDNGIGFSNSENDVVHFGINNLKQRAKELNGNIEWQQLKGTSVKIEIPLWNLKNNV